MDCWELSAPGESCSQLCGSEDSTDLTKWNSVDAAYRREVINQLSSDHCAILPQCSGSQPESWAAQSAQAVNLVEPCGSVSLPGYGSQYLYTTLGYMWDCFPKSTYFQIDAIYRAPCLCLHRPTDQGGSYFKGFLLGIVLCAFF